LSRGSPSPGWSLTRGGRHGKRQDGANGRRRNRPRHHSSHTLSHWQLSSRATRQSLGFQIVVQRRPLLEQELLLETLAQSQSDQF
jgi:hypothetical protein